jgi:hypothetical protein
MWVLQLRRRNLVWVLRPHAGIAKEEKNPTCVLRPDVGIAIEEKKFNMCFANDMKKLYTLGVLVFMEVLWVHFFKHVC